MADPEPPRAIRVFVSSTFRDMQREREELVKRVFPEIRRMCERRGVTFAEVDLRWGITDEEKAEGAVLPICLAEIERSRPFFLGLLGERYGWVPDEIPADLLESEGWLAQGAGAGLSVTELEVLHGVLNDRDMAGHAFFYLRDPRALEDLPDDERETFLEGPTPQELARLGQDEAEARAEGRRRRLAALKDRLRASGLPVREDYPDEVALGRMVREDLTGLVERLFPESRPPDPLDREAADHAAYAASRFSVHVGADRLLDRLDEHAAGDGPPLVITGPAGSGKSALVANWVRRRRAGGDHAAGAAAGVSATPVVEHYVGATADSADWRATLTRLLGELKRRLGLVDRVPEDPAGLRAALASWLHLAAARGRIAIAIDGLDQLEDRDGAPDLSWLPPELPPNVRLVLSTQSGRSLEASRSRGWPELEMEPLAPAQRRELVRTVLERHSKRLAADQLERIASAPQAARPLYLRALVDELRQHGDHLTLPQTIDGYLEATGLDGLYERVLARLERDFERDRPGLVGDALTRLWASRRGLSEPELMRFLGAGGDPLPGAVWSPLALAAEASLVDRSGLIGFAHEAMRSAVERRYLPDDAGRGAAHARLADEVAGLEGPRRLEELPWQLAAAGRLDDLAALLADLDLTDDLYRTRLSDLRGYWARLETESPHRMTTAYRAVIDDPAGHPDAVWGVGRLLADGGHPLESLALQRFSVERARADGDPRGLQGALGNLAGLLIQRGEGAEALSALAEQEAICRRLGDRAGLQRSLGNQGLLRRDRGELAWALALMAEELAICRELGDEDGVQASLGNQATVLRLRGDRDGALALMVEQERICRGRGDLMGVARALQAQGVIASDRGDLATAETHALEYERISRRLGDLTGVHVALGNRATILMRRGDGAGALALLAQEEAICRRLGDPTGLNRALVVQATILQQGGERDRAEALLVEAEQVARQARAPAAVALAIGVRATILRERGDLDGADALHREEERLAREANNASQLVTSLANQANVLVARDDLDAAARRYEEALDLAESLGMPFALPTVLPNLRQVLVTLAQGAMARADLPAVVDYQRRVERVARAEGDEAFLQAVIGDRGLALLNAGRAEEALALMVEQEQICRRIGHQEGLAASVGNQAIAAAARGDREESVRLLAEQERIARGGDNLGGVIIALANRGEVLSAIPGRRAEALAALEESHRLAAKAGAVEMARQIQILVDRVRAGGA